MSFELKRARVLGGKVNAPEIISVCIEIRSMVEDILDILKRRCGVDLPRYYIKGVRKAQFEEAVRLWGGNPRPCKAAVRRIALKNHPGRDDDPGFTDRSLKRYMESKPEYFPD